MSDTTSEAATTEPVLERVRKHICRTGKRHWATDPEPDGSKTRRVCSGGGDCPFSEIHARAILREVADWADETSANGGFHPAGFPEHVAEVLREQAAEEGEDADS